MSVKFTENPSFQTKLEDLIAERLKAVGEYISETLIAELDRQYPIAGRASGASVPNEWPARRTGMLQDSVSSDFDLSQMEILVGPEAWRIPYVERLVTMDRYFAHKVLERDIEHIINLFFRG